MYTGKLNKSIFNNLNILIIGDAMLDAYYYGSISRNSPEANVPIVDVNQMENRLGGAANVALNVKTLGGTAHLMSFKGSDDKAALLSSLLHTEDITYLAVDSERKTTVKTRIYNKNEYVLRIDNEDITPISTPSLALLRNQLTSTINSVKIDAVVLQDYNKGFFTKESIALITSLLKEHKIPYAVDPKIAHFFDYKGAALFKPNLKEINTALKSNIKGNETDKIKQACNKLLAASQSEQILLTLAENGAVASNHTKFYKVKAHKRDVVDVSGAGDTVIATASLMLALQAPLKDILHYSNLAGGLVIEKRGVQALHIEDLVAND